MQRLLARGELKHNIAERGALDDLEGGWLVGNLVLRVKIGASKGEKGEGRLDE